MNGFNEIFIPNVNIPDWHAAAILTGAPQALAATGTNQATAALITEVSTIVSAADGTKGVRLPAPDAPVAGKNYFITNSDAAQNLKVYPPTGGAINGGSTNAAVTVGAKVTGLFLFNSATAIWELVSDPSSATAAAAAQTAAESAATSAAASLASITASGLIQSKEVTFTETSGAGTYTGAVAVPAGATILDIIVNGVALWNNAGTATLKVGDTTDDGYYTGVNLKATDLLAGESLSFALAGGKAGAYIANSQVSPRYAVGARTINGIITTSSTGGTTGRTRMTVVYSVPTPTAAVKV